MATRVVITLQDDVYQRVARLARLTHRDVALLLADTIALSFPPVEAPAASVRDMTTLSDEEILQLSALQSSPAQDRRLSQLLQKQQERELSTREHAKLSAFMQGYPAVRTGKKCV